MYETGFASHPVCTLCSCWVSHDVTTNANKYLVSKPKIIKLVEELGMWEGIQRSRMFGSGLIFLTTVNSGGFFLNTVMNYFFLLFHRAFLFT